MVIVLKCILCFSSLEKPSDKNRIDGRGEFKVLNELLDLPTVIVRCSEHICKKCLTVLKRRRGLKENLKQLDKDIKENYERTLKENKNDNILHATSKCKLAYQDSLVDKADVKRPESMQTVGPNVLFNSYPDHPIRASRGSTKFLCTNARGPGKFFLTNARGSGKSYSTNARGREFCFQPCHQSIKFIVSDVVNCFNIWYCEGTQGFLILLTLSLSCSSKIFCLVDFVAVAVKAMNPVCLVTSDRLSFKLPYQAMNGFSSFSAVPL